MSASLPANVTVCDHPCLRVKLSKLRSSSTPPKEVQSLVRELAMLVATFALQGSLSTTTDGQDVSPLGYNFDVHRLTPQRIVIAPILRSGLAMVEGTRAPPSLPLSVITHHTPVR